MNSRPLTAAPMPPSFRILLLLLLCCLWLSHRGEAAPPPAPEVPAPASLCAGSGCTCYIDEIGRLTATCIVTSPAFPSKLPEKLSTLNIHCRTNLDGFGRPLVDMNQLTRIPDKALQGLPNLAEVLIAKCPVSELPAMLFANLTKLRQVTLESLLLVRLGGTLFWNSHNLESFQIINMADLKTIDKILLHSQRRLNTVTLKRMNISGTEVAKMIKPVRQTLNYFTWSMNFAPVYLPQNMFRGFHRLKRLDLRNNKLENLEFLVHTRTLTLILEKNPQLATSPPFDFSRCLQLRDLVELDLRATNMRHMGREFANFRHLRNLYLGNNHLSVVPEVIHTHLNDTLEKLDLSYNRIQVFPKVLESLFLNPRFEPAIEGNPLHCNCEARWLFNFPPFLSDLRCATAPQRKLRLKGRLLMNFKPRDLVCDPPTGPKIIVKNAVQTRNNFYGIRAAALASSFDETIIKYDGLSPIGIARGQTLILRCDSSGDPAPDLFWLFPSGFTLKRMSDPDRTLKKNLIEAQIQHSHLKRYREAKFVCRAKNVAGKREAFVVLKNLNPPDEDIGSTEGISKSVTAQPSKRGPDGTATTAAPGWTTVLLCLLLAGVIM